MSKTKHDSCLSGPSRNILARLQPSVDCQSLQCELSAHDHISVHTVVTATPISGSGPTNPSQAGQLISYLIAWNSEVSRNPNQSNAVEQ